MFYVIDYDADSNVVYESESLELCFDFAENAGVEFGVVADQDELEDFEDDFIFINFSWRTFLYKVVRWIKSYCKEVKI